MIHTDAKENLPQGIHITDHTLELDRSFTPSDFPIARYELLKSCIMGPNGFDTSAEEVVARILEKCHEEGQMVAVSSLLLVAEIKSELDRRMVVLKGKDPINTPETKVVRFRQSGHIEDPGASSPIMITAFMESQIQRVIGKAESRISGFNPEKAIETLLGQVISRLQQQGRVVVEAGENEEQIIALSRSMLVELEANQPEAADFQDGRLFSNTPDGHAALAEIHKDTKARFEQIRLERLKKSATQDYTDCTEAQDFCEIPDPENRRPSLEEILEAITPEVAQAISKLENPKLIVVPVGTNFDQKIGNTERLFETCTNLDLSGAGVQNNIRAALAPAMGDKTPYESVSVDQDIESTMTEWMPRDINSAKTKAQRAEAMEYSTPGWDILLVDGGENAAEETLNKTAIEATAHANRDGFVLLDPDAYQTLQMVKQRLEPNKPYDLKTTCWLNNFQADRGRVTQAWGNLPNAYHETNTVHFYGHRPTDITADAPQTAVGYRRAYRLKLPRLKLASNE